MISKEFELPEDVQVEVQHNEVIVTFQGKENKRQFKAKHIEIKKEGNKIIVLTKSTKKKDAAIVGTVMGHITNMVLGVKNGVIYKMKVIYSHFPMTTKVENGRFIVDNFLGEKKQRILQLTSGVDIKMEGQDITLTGINKEQVSLTAGQIEQLCKVTGRDRRVFQDGIYIVEKNGRALLK
jgi:large subunit ribosomal protein L6